MATNSNMGFHQGTLIPPSALNRHAISFQSGAINSSTGILSPDSGGFVDAFTTLKHDTGLAVEWSLEEQARLEKGLIKYANETNIMKYIKIAAELRDKTVRDVALRSRWMTRKEIGKRRKPEDYYSGKKLKDRRDKMVDSSMRGNICSVPQLNMGTNMGTYPLMMLTDNTSSLSRQVSSVITVTTRHLLEENFRVFNQIAANLEAFKVQDNIDLFCHTRNNIVTILNNMRGMSGMMSRMPPLQVAMNEELASTIPPLATQGALYSNSSVQLKSL